MTGPQATESLPSFTAELNHGIELGLHPGAQCYASIDLRTVADFAVGDAKPGVPMRPDSITLWFSAVKPLGAAAFGQLWEQGLARLDDPVARHVPEFAQHSKESITLRHLLTHTAGIRGSASTWSLRPWHEIIADICAARPEPRWDPEWRAGYDAAASWFILGEVIRRISGIAYGQYVREKVCIPCGMSDTYVGLPLEMLEDARDRLAVMFDTRRGGNGNQMPANSDEGITACIPGANGRGSARDLGRFYEMLLNDGSWDGRRILGAQTVAALTARHRAGIFDQSMQHIVDWGLGFLLNSRHHGVETAPYGYGPHASPRTFGHSGNQSSIAFCDAANRLVAVIITNGMPGEAHHQQRMRRLLTALYEDLSLTPGESDR